MPIDSNHEPAFEGLDVGLRSNYSHSLDSLRTQSQHVTKRSVREPDMGMYRTHLFTIPFSFPVFLDNSMFSSILPLQPL